MISNKTNLLPLDNSIKKPSSTNMMQPFTGGPDLIRRCSTIGSSISSTFAFEAQKHHLSLDLKKKAEELKIEEELDNWGKTQPENNQVNVKIAKERILECYKNRRSELSLENLGLTSVPSFVLQKLDKLNVLNLSNNQLSSFDGTGLTNLTHLFLNNNQLSSFDGKGFTNLIELHLENNHLTSFIGTGLTNLTHLVLNNNKLTSFIGTGLINLTVLVLNNNKLTSFIGTGFTNLRELYLQNNHLTSFIGTGLTNLAWLYLNNNQLSSFDRTGLINLAHLFLSNNQLSSFDGTGLTNLTVLFLNNNKLTSFIGTGLTNLIELHLNHNQLISFDRTGLINLAHLILNNNQLTSFIGTELINLERLYLNNNQLSLFVGTGLTKLSILSIENNPALNQLPLSLGQCRALRNIQCSLTSIPQSLINTILSSCRALRNRSNAFDLPIKLNLWKVFAQVDTNFDFINSFSEEDKATLNEWLERLERSKDFRENQQNLALVVCNILKDLQKKEFKELALVQMEANNKACQDRAAMALNELFLSWNLYCPSQDLSNAQKLDLIIRAGKTLALHKAIAEQLEGRTDLEESVETYLFYEIKFAKELNLLTCIQNMSYAGCSKPLDEEELKNYVEENFLKEAASIPILDNLLEESFASANPVAAKSQNDIERSNYYARKQLELLEQKEPQKQENETEEELKHRYLEWESEMNKIARENNDRIIGIKMDYLKNCKIK